jgi:hydroxymethylglutaryl-CoA lyase
MSKHHLNLPKEVDLGEITVRDGLQVLEHYFPVEDKVRLTEDLILAGFKHVEVTNFGHPKFLPQFKDADELLLRLLDSERVGPLLKQNGGETTICAVTINERALDRALAFKAKHGRGPDYVLQMVSTDPVHHKTNSGADLDDYWKMTEVCTKKAAEAGIKMCGTVSTIWGSPMKGSRITDLKIGVDFSKQYLELGADYIEQADHDGSGDPARVYEYFSMILDPDIMGKWADPKYHLCHCHTSRGMGLANYLAALQAGITRFETTLSGTGGQPAHTVDGRFTGGTGQYYYSEHLFAGLVSTEDFVVMCEAMGIKTGIDIRKLLEVGRVFRDDYLKIKAADRRTLLENVAETTGLTVEKLLPLEQSDDALDGLVDKATKLKTVEGSAAQEHLRDNMAALLHGLKNYLRWKTWGPSRSESIISDIPPSPHLKDLLGE